MDPENKWSSLRCMLVFLKFKWLIWFPSMLHFSHNDQFRSGLLHGHLIPKTKPGKGYSAFCKSWYFNVRALSERAIYGAGRKRSTMSCMIYIFMGSAAYASRSHLRYNTRSNFMLWIIGLQWDMLKQRSIQFVKTQERQMMVKSRDHLKNGAKPKSQMSRR